MNGMKEPGPSSVSNAEEFHASKGWFDWFVKHYELQIGKSHKEAASEDTEAAEKYPKTFKQLIKEKGFKPEQVFNMDGTGLFWKKMPSRTYLMKDEMKAPEFETQKDRVTLIMWQCYWLYDETWCHL